MKPDTKTLAGMLAQLTDPDSIAVLLDTFRPIETPEKSLVEQVIDEYPETLFGHYQSRKPEKTARNQHRRWTPGERAQLRELHSQEMSPRYIASRLQRSVGGVVRQIDKLEGRA